MEQRTRLQNTLDKLIKEEYEHDLQTMRVALLVMFGAGFALGVFVTLLFIG